MQHNPLYVFSETRPQSNIVLSAGAEEMLKITKDAFYVRGVKVPQDAEEAQTVYNAFLQWMSYMALTRNY